MSNPIVRLTKADRECARRSRIPLAAFAAEKQRLHSLDRAARGLTTLAEDAPEQDGASSMEKIVAALGLPPEAKEAEVLDAIAALVSQAPQAGQQQQPKAGQQQQAGQQQAGQQQSSQQQQGGPLKKVTTEYHAYRAGGRR